MSKSRLILFCIIVLFGGCRAAQSQNVTHPARHSGVKEVKVGAQVLLDRYLHELKGKRVGLVMNPTARVNGVHMLDTLEALGVHITALYGPEHGFRGQKGAGEHIENGIDRATGLPVYSLYGKHRKPTPAMLNNVDVLLFDMQDVGARFYTYISTLGLVLEAATPLHIPVWVLDRPDPNGGNYVAGWIIQPKLKSFVGEYPVPIAYGMTIGELARMMVGEHWIPLHGKPELRVIPCENLRRSMRWPSMGLSWFAPSPNLPHYENALVYLGTCYFEGSTFSEGRGTPEPFLTLGSPHLHLKTADLNFIRNKYHITIKKINFIPRSIPGKSLHPKYEGKVCHGVSIHVPQNVIASFDPVSFGMDLLRVFLHDSAQDTVKPYLYNLVGSRQINKFLFSKTYRSPQSYWKKQTLKFREERSKYLIYH